MFLLVRNFLLVCPDPIAYFWHIFEIGSYIGVVFGQQIIALLNEWCRQMLETRCTLQCQDAEMIPAHFIEYDHIERSSGRPLFFKPAHMKTIGIGASVNELVDDSPITVKCEHDGLAVCKEFREGGLI